jgi:hypothetical protein
MKKLLPCLFFCLPLWVSAQKEDNVWIFGYRYTSQPLANGITFTFDDSLTISYFQKPMAISDSHASICDAEGALLLYTNGCYIAGPDHQMIENSAGLNPGISYNNQCLNGFGYNIPQNHILLPAPGYTNLFYLFHYPIVKETSIFAKNLLVTQINLDPLVDSVVFKNQVVVQDSIDGVGLHAVRHANGRDWWLICAKELSNRYYITLITPDSISTHYQDIGIPATYETAGELVFSPDGSRLARFDTRDDLRLFDFDRCNGLLSNPQHFPIDDEANLQILAGLAWSADGRYLYAAEGIILYQFDMLADDIGASRTRVAEYDPNITCFLNSTFQYMELGPDGRIYSRPANGTCCMNRIKSPERPGLACTVEQRYFQFDYCYKNIPNFPNFRLGPIDGAPCDTLGLDNMPLADWRYDRSGILQAEFSSVSWYEPQTWTWNFGDGSPLVSEQHPVHDFPAPGPYEVCLTVTNNNGSHTKCKTVWITTTTTSDDWTPLTPPVKTLYPNPAKDWLFWTDTSPGDTQWADVFDARGVLLRHTQVQEPRLSVSDLPQGQYLLRLTGARGVSVHKFVVQR